MNTHTPGITLKTLLASSGGKVISIEPRSDLRAAAKLLCTHHSGALAVLDQDGHAIGILSERDIVQIIARAGDAVLHLPVTQAMMRNVLTCDVNDSIDSVMQRMMERKTRHMLVLENGRLADVVSIGYVLQLHIIETLREYVYQLRTM
jgi:CBS domain-containing protein